MTDKHGYEPEPWGSGMCICGLPDDADCHWPDAPEGVHAANIQSELDRVEGLATPRLVPSWMFVVPESDPHDLEMRANPYDFDDDERRGF